jgi:hypothetical protein
VNLRAIIRWSVLAGVLLLVGLSAQGTRAATTILPPGLTCFTGNSGPASNGSMNMFQPGTSLPKTTYQDPNQAAMNSQPIQLDALGCATIYGVGSYRQQLFDGPVVGGLTTGNLIFDKLTTDTSASNSTFWAGLAAGTPNAITIVYPGFNATDGSIVQFIPVSSNTGPTTLNPSGFGAISIVKDTTTGAVALAGGEIVASSPSNVVSAVYSASQANFHLLNLVNQSAAQTSQTLCGAIGLKIVNDTSTPNSKIDITAKQITMINGAGQTVSRTNVSFVLNFTVSNVANGLDTSSLTSSTWYNIWVIDNGSAGASLGSLSATAPTMPSGYSYSCRLGAMQTDGSSNFFRSLQLGNSTQYTVKAATNVPKLPQIATGVQGSGSASSPTYASVSVSGQVPPTATKISIVLNPQSTGSTACFAAPNTSYGSDAGTNPPPLDVNTGGSTANVVLTGTLVLESTNIALFGAGSSSCTWQALGWQDAVNAY